MYFVTVNAVRFVIGFNYFSDVAFMQQTYAFSRDSWLLI